MTLRATSSSRYATLNLNNDFVDNIGQNTACVKKVGNPVHDASVICNKVGIGGGCDFDMLVFIDQYYVPSHPNGLPCVSPKVAVQARNGPGGGPTPKTDAATGPGIFAPLDDVIGAQFFLNGQPADTASC